MRFIGRPYLTVLFFSLVLLLLGASGGIAAYAQKHEGFVIEGKSLDNILIGRSTMANVMAAYGKDYTMFKHGTYSNEMIYKKLGISFYSCQDDPKKEIFTIEMGFPFRATTSKGIILGESTLGDVFSVYGDEGGKIYSDSDQQGIFFFVEEEGDPNRAYQPAIFEPDSPELEMHKTKKIKRFELIEKTGLRQCDDFRRENK